MKLVELKHKVRHEMIEYGLNVVYLSVVFSAFRTYKWLLLADHGIDFGDYGFAFIEALVIGKVSARSTRTESRAFAIRISDAQSHARPRCFKPLRRSMTCNDPGELR